VLLVLHVAAKRSMIAPDGLGAGERLLLVGLHPLDEAVDAARCVARDADDEGRGVVVPDGRQPGVSRSSRHLA
jgi:hypothetical protein